MLHLVAVGIDQYKDSSIAPLRFARADAEAFGAMFERGIHPTERQVTYLLDGDATHDAIRDVIGEQLVRTAVEHEDVVVMYFAGHGSPETDGSPDCASRYLITHDTQYEKVYATGIDMERAIGWSSRASNGLGAACMRAVDTRRYRAVVWMSACPSRTWMVRRSAPASSMWVAKL